MTVGDSVPSEVDQLLFLLFLYSRNHFFLFCTHTNTETMCLSNILTIDRENAHLIVLVL